MNTGEKKPNFRARPKMTPREKKGLAIIAALFFATYVLVILVLGGQVPGEPFLLLDPTGYLQHWAQRWVNASIPYRERMVPVFIINVYFYVAVMGVTFMTRSWENMWEWATRYELWRLSLAVIMLISGSIFYLMVGRESPAQNSHELSRYFERQAFANKYSFILMLGALAMLSYWTAEMTSVFGEKIKLMLTKEKNHGN